MAYGASRKQIVISGGPWICEKTIHWLIRYIAPLLDRIEYRILLPVLEECPRVKEWFNKIKSRKSFLEAMPPYEYRMWGPKKPIPNKQVGSDAPRIVSAKWLQNKCLNPCSKNRKAARLADHEKFYSKTTNLTMLLRS